jgi:hypothetical protein
MAETKATEAKKTKTVTIKLPLTRDEKEDVYVSVNGKRYQIKRGVAVDVPWNVAKVLERSERMTSIAIEYENKAAEQLNELLAQR